MRMDAYVTPTNDIDYKSHRIYLTNRLGFISHHIMPLVANSLGMDTHAHTHINMQTFMDRSNYKKPGARRPVHAPSLKIPKIHCKSKNTIQLQQE